VRSGRLRSAAIAGVLAAALTVPAAAQDAVVGQDQIDESVLPLDVEGSVLPIDVEDSVLSLQTERERDGRVSVSVASDVLFEFDRARLTSQARVTIARVAGRIRDAGGPVRVDGHTDSLGSAPYNLRLSRRRAAAVSAALRADLPTRIAIRARGFGEADPVEPNTIGGRDNPEGRARNRRVTISFARR
jgi:OmpA-OmpF porin, OOP family